MQPILEAPLGLGMTVKCPHCRRSFHGSLGPAGLQYVTVLTIEHLGKAHPRAWAAHCRTMSAPASFQHVGSVAQR